MTGVNPASGPTSGGTAVTISGAGFLGAVAVSFGGSSSTTFVVQNDNEILAVTPPHTAGVVDVVVYNAVTSSITTGSGIFTYTSALVVTGLSPNAGLAAGGQTVTVSGAGFLSATSVAFGGVTGSNLHILNDNTLTVNAPTHGAAVVHVIVYSPDASSPATDADLFTYTAPPPEANPPARFAGRVVFNGGNAPAGTGVQAYIGLALCGSSTVFGSGGETRYVVDVAVNDDAHPGCGGEGATVAFWVGGFQVQSGTWHNYQLNNMDLVVGSGQPPVTAVPTPTASAPLPPNTGSLGTPPTSGGSQSWVLFVLLGTAAMVVATGTLAGSRRRHAPAAVTAAAAPAPSGGEAAVERRRGGGSSWLAIAGVGAAAVVAGTVIARRRKK